MWNNGRKYYLRGCSGYDPTWLQSRRTILPNGETELHDDYDYGNDDNDFDENSAVYDDEVA